MSQSPVVKKPQSADDLKKYALAMVGQGVNRLNISDDQVNIRLREALDMFNDFHFDATMHLYVKQQLTATDITNNYITVPSYIMEVVRALNFNGLPSTDGLLWMPGGMALPTTGWIGGGAADVAGGFGSSDPGGSPFNFTDQIQLYQVSEAQANMQEILFHENPVRFNKLSHRLYFDVSFTQLQVGYYVVMECFCKVEDLNFPDLWNADWLKRYFTALVGLQWGKNLTKFENQSLYGGTARVNGQGILRMYQEEVKDLEAELHDKWKAQPMFWTG